MRFLAVAFCTLFLIFSSDLRAKTGKSSKGTGAKSSSTSVRGHVTKKGTYVTPHKRSTPDKSKSNNWTTKGNTNPYTGKKGSK